MLRLDYGETYHTTPRFYNLVVYRGEIYARSFILFSRLRLLFPMAANPDEAAAAAFPCPVHPCRSRSRTHDPSAAHPFVIRSVPSPVTARPNISRAGRDGHSLHSDCWRRLRYDHFSNYWRWPASGHNLTSDFSGCCRDNGGWWRRRDHATSQRGCSQCDCVKFCSHITFRFLWIRFSRVTWLCSNLTKSRQDSIASNSGKRILIR